MFEVHGRTIRLSQGDTGIVTFSVAGVTLTEADRAVFTAKSSGGARLIQKVLEPVDGCFCVPFANEETDGFKPGRYEWDLRIALDARMDESGMVIDGREVITPWPPGRLDVVKVVGRV